MLAFSGVRPRYAPNEDPSGQPPRSRLGLAITAIVAVAIAGGVAYWLWSAPVGETEHAISGRWLLDEDTRSWMGRTCVDLVFADTRQATVAIESQDNGVIVRFNDVKKTRLTAQYRGGRISARQIVSTSEVARFCGSQTVLDISLRLTRGGPDELVGRWTTPRCEVCPARSFRAVRLEPTSL